MDVRYRKYSTKCKECQIAISKMKCDYGSLKFMVG